MTASRTNFLTLKEARTLIELAERKHDGKVPLSHQIIALKKEIGEKTWHAELIMARVGAVDNALIYEIVDLKLALDNAYMEWMRDVAA